MCTRMRTALTTALLAVLGAGAVLARPPRRPAARATTTGCRAITTADVTIGRPSC